MIARALTFALSNFTLTLLVISLFCSLVAIPILSRRGCERSVSEAFLSFYCLITIGISFLYNFVMHVFFADMVARFIGWQNSPFQYEVGFASLGFAVVGILAFRQDRGLRLAAVVGPAFFLLGAAGGHIYQMVTAHNFAPGNAGVIFWTDLFVPALGFFLFGCRYRK